MPPPNQFTSELSKSGIKPDFMFFKFLAILIASAAISSSRFFSQTTETTIWNAMYNFIVHPERIVKRCPPGLGTGQYRWAVFRPVPCPTGFCRFSPWAVRPVPSRKSQNSLIGPVFVPANNKILNIFSSHFPNFEFSAFKILPKVCKVYQCGSRNISLKMMWKK